MSQYTRRFGAILGSIALVVTTSVAPSFATSSEPAASPAAGQPGRFADVPTNRGNPSRDGIQPGPAPDAKPATIWTFQIADEFHFTPIVANGIVYVGGWDRTLYALDATTGAERWRFAGGGSIDSASYANGMVFAADGSGTFRAIDAATGVVRWSAPVSANTFSPSVSDGVVYLGTTDGRLLGLDVTSGEVKTNYTAPAAVLRTTVSNGVAYFGAEDGLFRAVRVSDSSEMWHQLTLSQAISTAIVKDGVVYVAAIQNPGEASGELYAIDATSGTVIWRFRGPRGRSILPGILMAGILYAPSDDGLYALDATTGQMVWRADTPFGLTTAATADGELFYQVDDALISLRASDGSELWRVTVAPGTNSGAAVTGGFIFQADVAGTLHAFGPASLAPAPTTVPGATPEPSPSGEALELVATLDSTAIPGLDHPSGMDVGPDGLLYLVSAGSDEIIVLDPDGKVVRRWGERGTGDGQLDFLRDPTDPGSAAGGVTIAPDGTVYVDDTANHRVQAFGPKGRFLRAWGSYGTGDGQFLEPTDIAAGPDGSVFVVDDLRDDIQQFTGDGAYVRTIGRHGTGDGELNFTGSIFVGPDGTLMNADWDNNRVQAWDATGAFLWTLGSRGRTPGKFQTPIDIGLDVQGNLYVVEGHRIQVFGPDRKLIAAWNPGTFRQADELGAIAFDRSGNVWVGQGWSGRLLKLRVAVGSN